VDLAQEQAEAAEANEESAIEETTVDNEPTAAPEA